MTEREADEFIATALAAQRRDIDSVPYPTVDWLREGEVR
jgi:hypothetical protein